MTWSSQPGLRPQGTSSEVRIIFQNCVGLTKYLDLGVIVQYQILSGVEHEVDIQQLGMLFEWIKQF